MLIIAQKQVVRTIHATKTVSNKIVIAQKNEWSVSVKVLVWACFSRRACKKTEHSEWSRIQQINKFWTNNTDQWMILRSCAFNIPFQNLCKNSMMPNKPISEANQSVAGPCTGYLGFRCHALREKKKIPAPRTASGRTLYMTLSRHKQECKHSYFFFVYSNSV